MASIAANASTIAITRLEDRADAGDTAMAANMAVRDNINRVGITDKALEARSRSPVRIAVNTTSVDAAAIGHNLRVG